MSSLLSADRMSSLWRGGILLTTGVLNVVLGIVYLTGGFLDDGEADELNIHVGIYESSWNTTNMVNDTDAHFNGYGPPWWSDKEHLDLFYLVGVAVVLSGVVRTIAGIIAISKDAMCARCCPANGVGNFGHRIPGWHRFYMARWFEASTTLPMLIIALYALIGMRDTPHHLMIGSLVVSFAAFGAVNEAALVMVDGIEYEEKGNGSVVEVALLGDGKTDVEAVGVRVSRDGARRRRGAEPIGAYRPPTFRPRTYAGANQSGLSPALVIPVMLQILILSALTYFLVEANPTVGEEDADEISAINGMVIGTLVILWVWLVVHFINVGWASQEREHVGADIAVSIAVWIHIWVIAGYIISTKWTGLDNDSM